MQVPISMTIKNVELSHECCPQHLLVGTSRIRLRNREDDKQDKMHIERRKRAEIKKS